MCLVWGTTYLGIRIALESIPPFLMAAMRWITAGGLLVAVLRSRGERIPGRSEWPSLLFLGILLLGFGNGAVVFAQQTVPSGLTSVLVAAAPFWMVGTERALGGAERLTLARAIGLVVGFAGIVLLVWPELQSTSADRSGGAFLLGVAATQLACLGWAIGSSYSRRRQQSENVLAAASLQMLFAGIVLLVLGTLAGEWSSLRFTTRTASALVYLTIFGFDRRLLVVHLRAQAPAGLDRVALRVREPRDSRAARHNRAQRTPQPAHRARGCRGVRRLLAGQKNLGSSGFKEFGVQCR